MLNIEDLSYKKTDLPQEEYGTPKLVDDILYDNWCIWECPNCWKNLYENWCEDKIYCWYGQWVESFNKKTKEKEQKQVNRKWIWKKIKLFEGIYFYDRIWEIKNEGELSRLKFSVNNILVWFYFSYSLNRDHEGIIYSVPIKIIDYNIENEKHKYNLKRNKNLYRDIENAIRKIVTNNKYNNNL